MWRLLRVLPRRAKKTRRRLHRALLRFGRPEKPYFIARTDDGIAFVGDYRDGYAAFCAVVPDYDRPVVDFLVERAQGAQGSYLDIGTNMGIMATAMARALGERGEVIGFEPVLETAKRAAATFALNDLHNVRLFPVAVGDEDGEIRFFEAVGRSEGSSAHRTNFGKAIAWRETKVACRRLDSLWEEHRLDKVALLKVDVEGHELQALRGASQLLASQRPAVFYE